MTASKIPIHKICEYCGKEFIAWKSSTRFCNRTCNNRAYKQRFRERKVAAVEKDMHEKPIVLIKEKSLLNPHEVATLWGITTRDVYYLIDRKILRAAHLSTRITLIRHSDIDLMLEQNQDKRPRKTKQPITEFYTTQEIVDKFDISESGLFLFAKRENIPKVFQRGRTY